MYPTFGKKRVSEVTSADVLAVLLPLWHTKPPTAHAVRQRIGTVMKWAIAKGFRPDNPAGDAIGAALPKNGGPKHYRALPHSEVGSALAKMGVSAGASLPTAHLVPGQAHPASRSCCR